VTGPGAASGAALGVAGLADEPPAITIEELSDPAGVPRARAMLQRAEWAARAFARYDKQAVDRIVHAAAQAGAAKAREYAEWAVRETGFGVAEHKVIKNVACSTGLAEAYATHDYVTPRFDPVTKIVEVPRPAGVILALTPSTNPVATVFFKSLLALMTRSAVVISPHPLARECCADAARTLAAAAVAAGAPDGVIQVVDQPSVPLINALMTDERTSLIVATGGVPVVRAAYSSGTPAAGVGPGNVPVLVDATADLPKAAKRIVDSKSFDNSVLCTNESVLIVEDAIAATLLRHLKREGAHLLEPSDAAKVAALLFPGGHFDIRFVGRDAPWIASEAGLRVPGTTRVLLAPFPLVVPEEPLAHEKLCPVLGLVQVPNARRGIDAARAVLRIAGRGHSAAIHSTDPRTIMEFGAAVEVLRVSVNAGNSLGSSGISTHLAPSMTVGTGFFGRSSLVENLEPKHFVQWTRLAYNSDPSEPFGSFSGLVPWESPAGPVPAYPVASNMAEVRGGRGGHPDAAPGGTPHPGNTPAHLASGSGRVSGPGSAGGLEPQVADALREEIRRVVVEELARFAGGFRG
jgi:acyl-CoA reductase-like NAD-dependent aldehyde dehydrogenase